MDSSNVLLRSLHTRRRQAGDKALAAALGADKTMVSRVFSNQYGIKLDRIGAFLSALGLAVAEENQRAVSIPRPQYMALCHLAEAGAQAMRVTGRAEFTAGVPDRPAPPMDRWGG